MNELQIIEQKGKFKFTPIGMVIDGQPTLEEWIPTWEYARKFEGAIQFCLGDLLNYGVKNLGENEISQYLDGKDYSTLQNYKYVCNQIPASRRRESVTFSVHYEIASVDGVKFQDKLLDEAEIEQLTVKEIKEKKRKLLSLAPALLPNGEFNIIYADPPWKYDFSETYSRQIENQYPTMDVEEICQMKIPSYSNSVLYMWATAPKLREALEVMSAWGFEYKTHMVWDKQTIGMGYWFRGQHELLMVGTKGFFSPPEESLRIPSLYTERKSSHSKKPLKFYEWIESWYPNGKYLELFARSKFNDKWTVYGNQI